MNPMAELELAIAAVRRAAVACRTIQAAMVDSETLQKKDRSPVTVADFASQALVCEALTASSAVTSIVGEESSKDLDAELSERVFGYVGDSLGTSVSAETVRGWIDAGNFTPDANARYWTLDPIDGTKGFLRAGHYAIALALIDAGEVVLAALGCPGWDSLLCAVRGQGARQLPLAMDADTDGEAIRVAAADDLRFCESVESGHSDQSRSAEIAKRLSITAPPLRMDSQAKYAAVARGDASIYLRLPTRKDYREKIWDHAAGMLVTVEAGGRVTDTTGAPLDFTHGRRLEHNAGVIATNGAIHDQVVAAVQATRPS